MTRRNAILRQLGSAAAGAVLLELVNVVANPGEQTALRVLTAALVGAVLGWFYDLARETGVVLGSALDQLEIVARKLDFQDAALDMMLASGNYGGVVRMLLSDSIERGFRTIAFSDENRYYRYLVHALDICDVIETIHRKPVAASWVESDASPYLAKLRDRSMRAKTRIFVIEPDDVGQMTSDLADPERMRRYWERTGTDMTTYWVPRAEFQSTYRNLPVPPDCVVFDRRLVISFDQESQTVSFDLLSENDPARRLFRALRDQQENNARTVFREVRAPS